MHGAGLSILNPDSWIVSSSRHRAREIRGAERVDDDLHGLALELEVALLGAAVEAEAVLETGAAAALDRDPEHRDVGLLGHTAREIFAAAAGVSGDSRALSEFPSGPHPTNAWLVVTPSPERLDFVTPVAHIFPGVRVPLVARSRPDNVSPFLGRSVDWLPLPDLRVPGIGNSGIDDRHVVSLSHNVRPAAPGLRVIPFESGVSRRAR